MAKSPGSPAVFYVMLEEELHADITIEARGGSVKAHRCVLACNSPVFKGMFRHGMQEQQTSVVNLPDMSIGAVNLFLQVIYCGYDAFDKQDENSLNLHWEEMFEACHKYQVPFLNACEKFMRTTISVDNWWVYLARADRWDPPDHVALREVCFKYMIKNCEVVTNTDAFLDATRKHPDIVVEFMRDVISHLKKSSR